MKARSAIQKGRRFEKYLVEQFNQAGFSAHREIGSGSGRAKGDLRVNCPFLIEAKNQERIQIWQAIDQAKRQAEIGNWAKEKWCLVFRDPRTPESSPAIYATVNFWEFLELLKRQKEPLIKEPDRAIAWKIKNLIQIAKSVVKELEK